MADQLTPQEYMAFLNSLASSAINGMLNRAEELYTQDPGRFPPLDDGLVFQLAALLGATVIEANPDYRDTSSFEKGAGELGAQTLEFLTVVGGMSDTSGRAMLFNLLAAAGGRPVRMVERGPKPN